MTSSEDNQNPTATDPKMIRGILTLVILAFIAAAGGIFMTGWLGKP